MTSRPDHTCINGGEPWCEACHDPSRVRPGVRESVHDEFLDVRIRDVLNRVISDHIWPQFTDRSTWPFDHYCPSCETGYTREAYKAHLRDQVIDAMREAA